MNTTNSNQAQPLTEYERIFQMYNSKKEGGEPCK